MYNLPIYLVSSVKHSSMISFTYALFKKSFRGVWRFPKIQYNLEEFILFREKSPPYSLLPYTIGVSEELELGCFCRRPGFCWQSIVEASKEEQGRRNQGCMGNNWPLKL